MADARLQSPGGGRGRSRTTRRGAEEVADFSVCLSYTQSLISEFICGSPVADGDCAPKICPPLVGVAVKIEDEAKTAAADATNG